MTIFDYLVLAVLACSVLISAVRGLVKEMLALVSWAVAFIVANAFGSALAPLLPAAVPGEALRLIVAFALLFIGVRLLMGLLTSMMDVLISATGLGLANRSLGGLFGLARGVVIVLLGVVVCGLTSVPQQLFWKDALLRPLAEDGVRGVKPFLPDAYAQYVHF
ncbi:membrane protein required for colicin V production [Oxalobacteraceae bacterium GrIS 1.11]